MRQLTISSQGTSAGVRNLQPLHAAQSVAVVTVRDAIVSVFQPRENISPYVLNILKIKPPL